MFRFHEDGDPRCAALSHPPHPHNPPLGGVLVGHAVVAGGDQSGGADELVAPVSAQGPLGHGGEGQVVLLQDGQAVLRLLLLHVEHLPQLLELLQLAEGLQHHQHDDQAQDQVH